MRIGFVRKFSSAGVLTLILTVSSLGCFTKVNSGAGAQGAKCTKDKNCREGLVCVLSGAGGGICQNPDAGAVGMDARASGTDGSLDGSDAGGTASDGKAEVSPDVTSAVKLDANAAETEAPDAVPVEMDAPLLVTDADQPDAPQVGSPDTRPADTTPPDTLPCNGGCCSNADCPLDKPACNQANACVRCTSDNDCAGRSQTACNQTSGACVQCTQKSHCGASLSCDLTSNTCVGCTNRSDCPGACQACNNGSCVSVKNTDDPSKCAGTCDSAGECKAKQGQKCDVAGGCISGTTCADGYCCNRACAGACEACDSATQPGTCTVLTTGSQPRHGTCGTSAGNNAACAGSCQGNLDGSCSYPSATTACGTAACNTSGQSQAAGACNGAGLCALPAPVSCKTGGTCAAGTCSCPASLPNECPTACVDFNTDAQNCGSCGHDCLGGTCLAGICQPVVACKPASSMKVEIFGLDSQYIYYENALNPMSANHDRISINATMGSATSLRKDTQAAGIGVIDGIVYFRPAPMGAPMFCSATDCTSTLAPLTNVGSAVLIPIPIPSLGTYATYLTDAGALTLKITWYDTGNRQVAPYSEDTQAGTTNDYFEAVDDSVYWIRKTTTEHSVYSVRSSDLVLKRMAGQLPADCQINNANPQSLLLLSASSLYRVPLPLGMGNDQPLLVLPGASADVDHAIEDKTFLYWADSAGTIYKCPSNDPANCRTKKILLTTGAPVTGFFQDSKNLYWGTLGTAAIPNAQLFRMAK